MAPTTPILWFIRMYRRWLSPLKGWKCAHGQEHGKNTCSQMGLRIFTKTTNPIKGALLLQRQFDRCADSAERLHPMGESLTTHPSKPFTRLLQNQRGDCDPGCDAGGCDLPDCGKCEMPTFSCPCSDPNPRSARSCDWSLCCDGPTCDKNKKSELSPKQQSKLATKRQMNKDKRTQRRLAAHDARAKRRAARQRSDNQQDNHDHGNDDD